MTVKADGEPALVQLAATIRKQYQCDMLFEHSPAHDPQSNGVAEKAVQDVMAQAHTLRLALEQRLQGRLEVSSPVIKWLVEHSAWMISHYRMGRDGRTAAQRINGRTPTQELYEFGEVVMAKPTRAKNREPAETSLDARWQRGVWLGVHDRTNERLVALQDGGPALRV